MSSASTFVEQVVDDLDLVRDLRAADDRDKRADGMLHRVAEILQLLLHEEAGRAFADGADDAVHRRVRAVGRPERVVDVEVGQLGQLPRKHRVVLLLRGVEAQVLEQHDVAAGMRLGHRRRGGLADAVAGEHDRPAQQRGQRRDQRLQAELRRDLALRPSEVRGEDDGRALVERVLNRRQRGPDPRVVADHAVLDRDVEVDADEDALAGQVEVRRSRAAVPIVICKSISNSQPFLASRIARSTHRLE